MFKKFINVLIIHLKYNDYDADRVLNFIKKLFYNLNCFKFFVKYRSNLSN